MCAKYTDTYMTFFYEIPFRPYNKYASLFTSPDSFEILCRIEIKSDQHFQLFFGISS